MYEGMQYKLDLSSFHHFSCPVSHGAGQGPGPVACLSSLLASAPVLALKERA
ncbi:hypothetical protein SACS_1630 [Parasaccharibacter apium]|uniref:Uncharacterized protein n=1 Tax=Parasaccharibacter apium TaxID=1510841 RepID=A0A7U7G762_9PROT|nr:hypothetical protein SACS_1630 [Parasaccharibacter apium]